MLQIIGWLGCIMLAVKLVEMCYNKALRNDEGSVPDQLFFVIIVGFVAVFGFSFWILVQGLAAADVQSQFDASYAEGSDSYLTEAERIEAQLACYDAAGEDFEAALECLPKD